MASSCGRRGSDPGVRTGSDWKILGTCVLFVSSFGGVGCFGHQATNSNSYSHNIQYGTTSRPPTTRFFLREYDFYGFTTMLWYNVSTPVYTCVHVCFCSIVYYMYLLVPFGTTKKEQQKRNQMCCFHESSCRCSIFLKATLDAKFHTLTLQSSAHVAIKVPVGLKDNP